MVIPHSILGILVASTIFPDLGVVVALARRNLSIGDGVVWGDVS